MKEGRRILSYLSRNKPTSSVNTSRLHMLNQNIYLKLPVIEMVNYVVNVGSNPLSKRAATNNHKNELILT
jgi:hypothetical protein